jgi:hypothetical protein
MGNLVQRKEYQPTHHIWDNVRGQDGGPYTVKTIREIVHEKARPQTGLRRGMKKVTLLELWKQQDRFILAHGGGDAQNTADLSAALGRDDMHFESMDAEEEDLDGPEGMPTIACPYQGKMKDDLIAWGIPTAGCRRKADYDRLWLPAQQARMPRMLGQTVNASTTTGEHTPENGNENDEAEKTKKSGSNATMASKSQILKRKRVQSAEEATLELHDDGISGATESQAQDTLPNNFQDFGRIQLEVVAPPGDGKNKRRKVDTRKTSQNFLTTTSPSGSQYDEDEQMGGVEHVVGIDTHDPKAKFGHKQLLDHMNVSKGTGANKHKTINKTLLVRTVTNAVPKQLRPNSSVNHPMNSEHVEQFHYDGDDEA